VSMINPSDRVEIMRHRFNVGAGRRPKGSDAAQYLRFGIRAPALCLAIRVARKLKAIDVIDVLSDLFILRVFLATSGPTMGRSSVAKAVREWITAVRRKHGLHRARQHACAMNCSTTKSSARCARPRSSSKVGGATSIQSGRTEPPAPEVFVPAFAAAALRRPVRPFALPLAQRPTPN
jgi:putative transposase